MDLETLALMTRMVNRMRGSCAYDLRAMAAELSRLADDIDRADVTDGHDYRPHALIKSSELSGVVARLAESDGIARAIRMAKGE